MPHYGFIAKVKLKDGKIQHFAWQRLATSRAEALKHVKSKLAEDNVYLPGTPKEKWGELLDILEAGECPEGYENSTQLYEDVCNKARKLDGKQDKKLSQIVPPTPPPKLAQGTGQLLAVK